METPHYTPPLFPLVRAPTFNTLFYTLLHTFATKNLKAHCDVARQPLWRYVKVRHRNCDDMCSFATNVKIYNFVFSFVAKHHVPIQLRWRPLTYRHKGCRATSQCAFKFLVANVTYKMNPRFFTTKRWNWFFCNLHREIRPLRVSKKYLRWYRRSRRIEWHPSIPPLFFGWTISLKTLITYKVQCFLELDLKSDGFWIRCLDGMQKNGFLNI